MASLVLRGVTEDTGSKAGSLLTCSLFYGSTEVPIFVYLVDGGLFRLVRELKLHQALSKVCYMHKESTFTYLCCLIDALKVFRCRRATLSVSPTSDGWLSRYTTLILSNPRAICHYCRISKLLQAWIEDSFCKKRGHSALTWCMTLSVPGRLQKRTKSNRRQHLTFPCINNRGR